MLISLLIGQLSKDDRQKVMTICSLRRCCKQDDPYWGWFKFVHRKEGVFSRFLRWQQLYMKAFLCLNVSACVCIKIVHFSVLPSGVFISVPLVCFSVPPPFVSLSFPLCISLFLPISSPPYRFFSAWSTFQMLTVNLFYLLFLFLSKVHCAHACLLLVVQV